MDIYNCPTVSVSGCIFAYNGPADIVKYVPYRGQSSGLSLGERQGEGGKGEGGKGEGGREGREI